MNLDNIDLVALQRDLDEFAREQQQRGWLRRNWLWLVPTLVVVLILLGCGAIYWAMFIRVYQLDVYQAAMRDIQADETLQSDLGQPITSANWPPPSPRIEAREQDIRWPIEGPKGSAKAHVSARLMQGKWEIIQLEVDLADGKRCSVASSSDSEANAPVFQAPEGEPQKPETETDAPPPVINLAVPPGDAPGM